MAVAIDRQTKKLAATREPLAFWLAVWFGCGLVPLAPGTAGTIGAIPLYLVLRNHGIAPLAITAVLISGVGIWASTRVAKVMQMKDPQIVVIDEVAGVLITWLGAPATPAGLIVGFALFRLFDQVKPFPARYCEKNLRPGLGIMFDDIFAGIWGAIVLLALRRVGWL